jgi:hypothetical protein
MIKQTGVRELRLTQPGEQFCASGVPERLCWM